MDKKQCVQVAIQIGKAMNYLHKHNPQVIHGDLKSTNILVDKNWTIKVGDFGLSRFKYEPFATRTFAWMAPEVLREEHSDEKSDVYSFRVVDYGKWLLRKSLGKVSIKWRLFLL